MTSHSNYSVVVNESCSSFPDLIFGVVPNISPRVYRILRDCIRPGIASGGECVYVEYQVICTCDSPWLAIVNILNFYVCLWCAMVFVCSSHSLLWRCCCIFSYSPAARVKVNEKPGGCWAQLASVWQHEVVHADFLNRYATWLQYCTECWSPKNIISVQSAYRGFIHSTGEAAGSWRSAASMQVTESRLRKSNHLEFLYSLSHQEYKIVDGLPR